MKDVIEKNMVRQMTVPVLDQETVARQVSKIVEDGMPQKRSLWEKIKDLYVGPGLRVVFYHSKSSIIVGILLYPVVMELIFMLGYDFVYREYMILLAFPMLHLILLILTNWADQDEHMVEMKWGLPYTAAHMIGLRMLYISTATALVNSLMFPRMYGWYGMKLALMGVSSIFLFSILMLLMVERMWNYYRMLAFGVVWSLGCLICACTAGELKVFLFETVPLAVHVLVMFGCILGLFLLIGKVGRKNAVAYKC